MFITIKYASYEEQIPISSILKFAKNYSPEKYEITLSEVSTKKHFAWNYGNVNNVVLEIFQESQPTAFLQIQNYLSSQN